MSAGSTRRGLRALLGAALLVGCGPAQSPSQYWIEVLGSRAALEAHQLRAEGMEDAGLFFERNRYLRVLRGAGELPLHERPTVSVESWREGSGIDSALLRPFVCQANPEKYQRLRAEGWQLVERHQLQLTDDGQLQRGTDLDRVLSYRCEATAPGGRDGEAWSTLGATVGACSEPDRAGTQIRLLQGERVLAAELCQATYLQLREGVVILSFSFPLPFEPAVTVQLGHCMDPAAATYPLALQLGAGFPAPGCPYAPSAQTIAGGAIVSGGALGGAWRIESLDFVDGGHLVGDVEMELEIPGIGKATLSGRIDLPLLRVPLSGGAR